MNIPSFFHISGNEREAKKITMNYSYNKKLHRHLVNNARKFVLKACFIICKFNKQSWILFSVTGYYYNLYANLNIIITSDPFYNEKWQNSLNNELVYLFQIPSSPSKIYCIQTSLFSFKENSRNYQRIPFQLHFS